MTVATSQELCLDYRKQGGSHHPIVAHDHSGAAFLEATISRTGINTSDIQFQLSTGSHRYLAN